MNMKYKFSFGQVFPALAIICGAVFANTLILGMIIYAFCVTGWLWNVMLIPLWLFLNFGFIAGLAWFHMDLGFGRIQADASGIRVVSRKGKIKRELHWEDIKKYSVCGLTPTKENYICLSENPDYLELRAYYPGVVWGLFYDKRTLTFPFSYELYEVCQKYITERTTLEGPKITGHISNHHDPSITKMQERNNKKYRIMLAVSVVVLILIFYLTFRYGNVHF